MAAIAARPGQAPVAVIAEKVWHQRFASDPHIVGRITRVNNRAVTIVGVAPDLTTGWLTPPNVWMPYTAQPYMDSSRNGFTDDTLLWLTLAGRLAPGFSRSQVRAEFDILERQEDRLHPGTRHRGHHHRWLLALGVRTLFLRARSLPAHLLPGLVHPGVAHRLRQRGHAPALARRLAPPRNRRPPFARRAARTPGPHADHREPDHGGASPAPPASTSCATCRNRSSATWRRAPRSTR